MAKELEHASFQSIATHGDGSIGVQVSKHPPVLDTGDLTTEGGEAFSLLKWLEACALLGPAGQQTR